MLYKEVYQDIVTDILSGKLKGGQSLPTVKEISKQKKISFNTIHAAFELLQKNGYIISAKKKGTVIVRETLPAYAALQYISERKNAYIEVIKMMKILSADFIINSVKLCTQSDFQKSQNVIDSINEHIHMEQCLKCWNDFCIFLTAPLKNELFIELTSAAKHFMCYSMIFFNTFPMDKDTLYQGMKKFMQTILDAAINQDVLKIRVRFDLHYNQWIEHMRDRLSFLPSCPDLKQISFVWFPDKSTRFVHLSVVNEITRNICLGIYPYNTYLPSQKNLRANYKASLTSLQNGMEILCKMGMLTLENGKGYMVRTSITPNDSLKPEEIRTYCTLFTVALQFWRITFCSVVSSVYPYFTAEDTARLEQIDSVLYAHPEGKFYSPSLLILSAITDKIPNLSMKSVYKRLECMLAYSSYNILRPLRIMTGEFERIHAVVIGALQSLKLDNEEGFTSSIKIILESLAKTAQQIYVKYNLSEPLPPLEIK